MINSVINNVVTNFIVSLAIDAIIFNIIYSTINSGVSYLKNVIIYTICLQLRLIIVTGVASFGLFLMAFGIYFVIGLALIWLLSKISEYMSRISFMVIGIVLQSVLAWIVGLIL